MCSKCVLKHKKSIDAHHKKHHKKLLQLYHKVRTHKGCYKAGKFPTRVPRGVPKSRPSKPKGLNKTGSGLWDHITKAWHWVTGQAKKAGKYVKEEAVKHGKVLLEEGKKRATAHAKHLMSRGKEWAKKQADQAMARARSKAEGYIRLADNRIESVAKRVHNTVDKYTSGK